MMKYVFAAFTAMISVGVATADVTVNFKEVPSGDKVTVVSLPIADMQKSRAERRAATVSDTLRVENSKLVFPIAAASSYSIELSEDQSIGFFAAPEENITIDIQSLNPLTYLMKGSELVDGIQTINTKTKPIADQISELRKQQSNDRAAMQALYDSYEKVLSDFIAENPKNTATPYALMSLGGEDLIKNFDSLTPEAQNSIIMPLVRAQYESALKRAEQEKKQQAMQSGDVEAPGFTLKNQEGKDVSLSDFKGKWVILDFWGTWCPWCIKGFPALKEAYAKYSGKLEIIGVDCNDSEEQWKNGIAKYELPWIQVYKPETDRKILEDYYVQGFPTKVIVNPEGKIANITVGENPEFFTILAGFIGE